ncbi:Major facilitator-type transporter ecdD [Colletotrichum siamense]|uniref:Major facilitator-type transporter ecdD n=1 Tax=Colletotrichum siamense TaxID=690259 RepID=UPI0018724A72|nr:Major facilitator-type transporter ecdD [Colletotrichum siamense]KAF5516570.1 Major facilitator-type transporter ecdD [Colletotrichum siamense]
MRTIWLPARRLPFSQEVTWSMGLLCLILGLNVLSNGFDLSVYNTIQAMDCVCVTYTSQSFSQVLAGRCIVHIYTGMESWLIPLFIAEVVPAKIRGMLVSGYMIGRLLGTIIISCVSFATSTWPGDSSWKTPVAVLFSIPSLMILVTAFVPESPRWLLVKEQYEEALVNLKGLNDSRAGFEGETELAAMKANLEQHTEKGSWADLFRGTDLRRTTIALLPPFFSQATGQAFANVYGTIFYQSLGTINPFVLTIISQCFGLIGSLSFMLLVDRVGRRFFWKSMVPLGGVSMMILGGLGTIRNPTQSEKLATACMLSLFGFSFLGSLAQLAAVTPAEVPSPRLRGKTAMMAWTVNNFSNFIATFTLPYLMNPGYGNLGPKVGFIYGSFSLISVVWGFFCFPELKGKTLDEVDMMFRANVPARKTSSWKSEGYIETMNHGKFEES